MPEVLAEQPKLENTSAEELWKDNETLLPNTKITYQVVKITITIKK